MKKALSAVLAVVLVLGVCFSVPMIASANNTDKFTYRLNEAGDGYIITGVKGNVTGEVEIPATYTLKEGEAFDDNGNVISIANPTNALSAEEPEVTFTAGANGTITATAQTGEGEVRSLTSGGAVAKNDKVVFTVAANAGYKVDTFTVGGEAAELTENKYTINAIDNDVTVEVTFVVDETQKFDVNVPDEANGCSVTAEPAAAYVGQTVKLTIVTAEGYQLDAISAGEGVGLTGSGTTRTFTMPAKDVDVTATFSLIPPTKYAIDITATNGTVTAKIGETAVTSAEKGAKVVLSVEPATGYEIDEITVTPASAYNAETKTITMPESNVTVTAKFKKVNYTITLNDVTDVVTLAVPEDAGLTANYGDEVVIYVIADANTYVVNGLTIAGVEDIEAISGTLPTGVIAGYKFTMPAANISVSADYANKYNSVNIADAVKDYVKVTTTADEGGKFVYNKSVTLKVTAPKGFELATLTVDGKAVTVNAQNEYTFTITKDVSVTAEFQAKTLDVVGIDAGAFNNATGIKSFKVAAGQTRFVAKDGVLFEKVVTPAQGETPETTTLKLIAFPANYTVEVEEGEVATYTIPAKVDTLDVTAVANGAFQALGNVQYVFCEARTGELAITESAQPAFGSMSEGENPTFTPNKKFHETAGHTEGALEIQTAATCQTAGTKIKKCTYCQAIVHTENYSDANAHNFLTTNEGWEVVIPATCQQQGSSKKECKNTRCTYVERRYDQVANHVWATDFTVDVEPTCEDGDVDTINTGSKSKHCTTPGCNATTEVTVIPALTHTVTDNQGNENIIAKKDATCTEAGFIKGYCDHCDEEVTITLTKLGHDYQVVVDAEATCTVDGWQHEQCSRCEDYKDGSDMKLVAIGHVAATVKNGDKTELKWTVVKAPTCSEDGLAEVRCENCGIQMVDPEGEIEYTRVLPATGKHDFGETWTQTKAPTCDEEGEETGTCACGFEKTRKIDALGHKWAEEYTVDTAATCTKKGSESIKCTVCGDKNEDSVRETALAAHTADDSWKTVEGKAATCYAEGEKAGKCAVCGADATLPIEKLAHKWAAEAVNLKANIAGKIQDTNEDGTPKVDAEGKPVMVDFTYTAPTCENKGYKAIYCENTGCTAHKEDSLVLVDALGHDFDDAYNTGIPTNKSATCKEAGYMFKWCKTCSATNTDNGNSGYVKIEIAQKAHEYKTEAEYLRAPITIKVEKVVDGKVELGKDGKPVMVDKTVSAPTCEDKGYTAVYCKNYETCGELKDVTEVVALGHLYDNTKWTKVSDATCMAKEIQSNTCLRPDCINKNQTREYGDFATHNYATTYTYEYQTCEKDGRKYYACTTTLDGKQCEAVSGVVVLEALGHQFATDAKFVGTEATCLTDGVKVKECLNCFEIGTGKPYEAPATGGTEQGGTAGGDTPAAQTEGGATTGTEGSATTTTRPAAPTGYEYCSGYEVVTPATGHAFAATYTEDLAATCEAKGSESRHCTNEGCTAKTGSKDIPALGHNYSEEYKTVTAATCQAEGSEARYCTNKDCTEYKYERKLAKTSHKYNDRTWANVEGKAPTCEATGTEFNNCTVCGERTEREAKALGHKWAETWTIVDAGCTTKGESYKACERANCNAKSELEETPALGHKLDSTDEGYVKVTATDTNKCTVESYEQGYCYVCNENNKNDLGKVKINVVAPVGHKFDTQPTVVDATCEGTGTITGKCSICSQENVSNTIPAKGHTFGDWELRKDDDGKPFANCTAEDSMIRKCTVKGCTGSELGENEKHTESGWILDSDATCKVNGKMHTECTVCATELKSQTLYATDAHDYEEDTTKRVEPTCNEPGSKKLICKVCKDEKTEVIKATDHTFTEWKVFVEPTCTEKGIRQSVCTVCLTTKSEKILALGHTESDWIVTDSTCTAVGEKHKDCTVCGIEIAGSSTEIAAKGHNYTTSNTCSAEGCEAKLYEYKLIGESTTDIEIVKYNGDEKNVVIPSEIDGYIVKAIGDRAFMNVVVVKGAEATETTPAGQDTTKCEKSTIETVTIPETVTTIGAYAFASASDNFKSVVIPGTVTTIGDYAFGYNATITWVEDTEAQVEQGAVRPLKETISAAQVADFAIYGVKDSAAAVYAAQDAEDATDDFKFAAIADIYEVAIPEGAEAEKAGNAVLFKEFAVKNADGTDAPSVEAQIAAVIDINVSGYSVEVEASQQYIAKDENGNVTATTNFYGTGTKVFVKDSANNIVDVIEIAVQGDVNGDGVCDAIDCMLIQLAAQNQKTLEGVYYTAGNVAPDTAIDAADLSATVLKIFGEDIIENVVEETTVPTTAAPTTTEPTTEAPASTEPSTEGTSESTTQAPAESTTQAPAESTTQTPAQAS